MKIKEVVELYNSLEKRISNLETQIVNHCGRHTSDRIVGYIQLLLMVVVIILLKFKVL